MSEASDSDSEPLGLLSVVEKTIGSITRVSESATREFKTPWSGGADDRELGLVLCDFIRELAITSLSVLQNIESATWREYVENRGTDRVIAPRAREMNDVAEFFLYRAELRERFRSSTDRDERDLITKLLTGLYQDFVNSSAFKTAKEYADRSDDYDLVVYEREAQMYRP